VLIRENKKKNGGRGGLQPGKKGKVIIVAEVGETDCSCIVSKQFSKHGE